MEENKKEERQIKVREEKSEKEIREERESDGREGGRS